MNAPSIRTFVAFDVPLEARQELAHRVRLHEGSFPGARWTDVASQHVTLRFIGWTPEDRVPDVAKICNEVSSAFLPSEVRIGPLGIFPGPRRCRVLWAGIEDPDGTATRLAAALDDRLSGAGFAGEQRSYTPHLTLARFKVPLKIDALPQVAVDDLPGSSLDRIVLYRSHLRSSGARYEALENFPLGSS